MSGRAFEASTNVRVKCQEAQIVDLALPDGTEQNMHGVLTDDHRLPPKTHHAVYICTSAPKESLQTCIKLTHTVWCQVAVELHEHGTTAQRTQDSSGRFTSRFCRAAG